MHPPAVLCSVLSPTLESSGVRGNTHQGWERWLKSYLGVTLLVPMRSIGEGEGRFTGVGEAFLSLLSAALEGADVSGDWRRVQTLDIGCFWRKYQVNGHIEQRRRARVGLGVSWDDLGNRPLWTCLGDRLRGVLDCEKRGVNGDARRRQISDCMTVWVCP
jgi:hypothetical protein